MNKKQALEKLKKITSNDLYDHDNSEVLDLIRVITDNQRVLNRFDMWCDNFDLSYVTDTVFDLLLDQPKYGFSHTNGNYLDKYESLKLKKIFSDYKKEKEQLDFELRLQLQAFVEKILKEDIDREWVGILEELELDWMEED